VSVKRRVGVEFRVGVGVGVGVEVGVRVALLYLFFIPLTQIRISSNLHQLCIVTIFSDLKEIKNVVELIFSHHPKQSRHILVKTVEYRIRNEEVHNV